ncbi:hypothetical protein VPH35_018582 [Triticum aestivum]
MKSCHTPKKQSIVHRKQHTNQEEHQNNVVMILCLFPIFRLRETYLWKLNNKSTAIAIKLHDNFKQYTGPPSYLQIYFIVILDMYLVLHTTYICIDHLYN